MNSVLTASSSSLAHLSSEPAMKRLKSSLSFSRGAGAAAEDMAPPLAADKEEPQKVVSPDPHAQQQPPLKATNFGHLRQKYLPELEYMLVEFQKLERQLLGAKAATRESAGSRERREKLHSFIQHLSDTIEQIHTGCALEAEGKSTVSTDELDNSLALSKLTQEKKEEENVQKLEEHILANLLPVKVRLKKQLAAQQGAKHNPAGMPVRGSLPPAPVAEGKTAFGGAVQERRKSIDTHFGKPLKGGGSSLTQKLHGATLGAENRVHGHGVGSTVSTSSSQHKVLYAGMAIGSEQVESSVAAASNAHRLLRLDSGAMEESTEVDDSTPGGAASTTLAPKPPPPLTTNNILSEEQRRRLKRKKRKRLKEREDKLVKEKEKATKRKKATAKKQRGPRAVEYMCALCNEVYASTCDCNPWWALSQHECPKCRKMQVRAERWIVLAVDALLSHLCVSRFLVSISVPQPTPLSTIPPCWRTLKTMVAPAATRPPCTCRPPISRRPFRPRRWPRTRMIPTPLARISRMRIGKGSCRMRKDHSIRTIQIWMPWRPCHRLSRLRRNDLVPSMQVPVWKITSRRVC